jgi:hypothetical protein
MRAYIQTNDRDDFYNVNAFVANEGFVTLGWETLKYHSVDDIVDEDPETLIVGGIGNVRKRLHRLGIDKPKEEIDYPTSLQPFLGRRVWASTAREVLQDETMRNIFIKPQKETKKFVGKLVREQRDFIGIIDPVDPVPVWCSEPVNFVTEWRCFIRYGQLWDVRQYKGSWDTKIDLAIVQQAIVAFANAPNAYAMDFGIDNAGNMKLVECNDGHSLGTYGIDSVKYAKFLSARWAQMTGTTDYAYF